MKNLKIDLFTRYGRRGASSRCRYFLYETMLEEAGISPHFQAFFSDRYLRRLYRTGRKSRLAYCAALVRRFFALIFMRAPAVIEYEALPFIPYPVERWLLGDRRYIVNYDDNVWEKYRKNPLLRHKFNLMVKHAAGVIAANRFLLEKVAPLNPHVLMLPTVVDLRDYDSQMPKYPKFTVVWIGTPVTYKYIESAAAILKAMAEQVDFELLVIAGADLKPRAIPGVNMRFVDWSEEEEARLLGAAHVGFMPLAYDSFSRGKSAYKIIQYLASGLPVIASDVGENSVVLEDGKCGYLCNKTEDYVKALDTLHRNRKIYSEMSASARTKAHCYSLDFYQGEFLNFIWQRLLKDEESATAPTSRNRAKTLN